MSERRRFLRTLERRARAATYARTPVTAPADDAEPTAAERMAVAIERAAYGRPGPDGRMSPECLADVRAILGLDPPQEEEPPAAAQRMARPGGGVARYSDDQPRETEAHEGKRPGEFAPKGGEKVGKGKGKKPGGSKPQELWRMPPEQLQRMESEDLDRAAFGFVNGATVKVDPNDLHILYDADLENAEAEANDSGDPKRWAKGIDLSEPIEVRIRNGRKMIDDGHHRYLAARILGKKLRAIVTIDDNPIKQIYANAAAAGHPLPAEALTDYPDLKPPAPDPGPKQYSRPGPPAIYAEDQPREEQPHKPPPEETESSMFANRAALPAVYAREMTPAPAPPSALEAALTGLAVALSRPQPAPVVNITLPPPPAVTIEAPVTVNVPKQEPPTVNVAAPRVTVEAPQVTVNMPEPKPRKMKVLRDDEDRITGSEEVE